VMRVDGSDVKRLTDNDAPDFSPAWSPDGRRIAFISWRDGNQDIYVFSLDDPRDAASFNLTNTPTRNEDYPVWSPDGKLLAYSALDEGVEKTFVKPTDDPNAVAQVLGRGRAPTWSPDGASLVVAVDSFDTTQLIAIPFAGSGFATLVIPVAQGASAPDWSAAVLPQALVNAGGLSSGVPDPLYIEQEQRSASDPPYQLNSLINVEAPIPALSDRVNDSFNALRERANQVAGWDFLGQIEDAFWEIDRLPQPGEERRNWLMTGRAFAINRNAIVGFPSPIEVVREDIDINTQWRVYVRVSEDAQIGQLGEPLRRMPWDFLSRSSGDVEAYNQGGKLRSQVPSGYYMDFTQLAADYGWERVPAGNDWRANFNSINFWLFQKRDGLQWYDAMRELYTEGQLGGFVQRVTVTPVQGAQPPQAEASVTPEPPSQPLPPPPTIESGDNGS
jgi:TolB protein